VDFDCPILYIKLFPTMRIYNVFHINLLTPYYETAAYTMPYTQPSPIIENNKEEYKVESITNIR
jgi:hypothetical protein